MRIDGSLFFGAVNHVRTRLRRMECREAEQRHLLVVASGVDFIDLEGADFRGEEAWRRRGAGGEPYLYDIEEGVCEVFPPGGHLKEIGEQNVFEAKTAAIAEIFERLDRERRRGCTARIFLECQALAEPAGGDGDNAPAIPDPNVGGKQ